MTQEERQETENLLNELYYGFIRIIENLNEDEYLEIDDWINFFDDTCTEYLYKYIWLQID